MGRLVIATYRPRPGRDGELLEILEKHIPVLRCEGIVTDRAPIVMRADDGTIVEAFELLSDQSVQRAQRSAKVRALWERLQKICEVVNLRGVADAELPPPGAGTSPLHL